MTDLQLLTMAIAVIFPLGMLIYSNSRITDTKDAVKTSVGEAKETLRAEMGTLRADMGAGFGRMDAAFDRLEAKLMIHELEHHRK